MRVILVGNRKLAKYVLQHLFEEDWNVVGAVAPTGQMASQQANFRSLDNIAQSNEIPLIKTEDINDGETVTDLQALEPELVICPGWSQIIEEKVLNIPSHGFTGFHSSELPKGRGGAPVNWSIIHGDSGICISLFYYTQGIDSGDILKQRRVSIEHRDNVSTIFEKLATAACDILSELKEPLHSGTIDPTPQSLESATYRPRRKPQDGIIDWERNPAKQHNWIRAQTRPYPGAYTFFENSKITIWKSELVEENSVSEAVPGEVTSIGERQGITVRAGDNDLRILRVQVDDEPILWADDFAERFGVDIGTEFGCDHAPKSWLYTGIRDEQGETHYTTNLKVGNSGTIQCLIRSPNRSRQIRAKATFEDHSIMDKVITVNGTVTQDCTYTPESKGTKTLKIELSDGVDYRDTRYLKIFSH